MFSTLAALNSSSLLASPSSSSGLARAAEIAGEIGRIVARARRTINSLTEDLRTQAREETEPLRSARESLRDIETELRRPLDIPDARPNTGRADPSADATADETAESPDDAADG